MNYIIWKDIDSRTLKGLIISELPPITKPAMRVQETIIDGVDGSIIEDLGYEAYDKEMTIGLHGDFDINEIIKYFSGEGNIVFSNEPDKYYKARIIDQIDYERLLRFRTASITFRVQPFKYKYQEEELEIDGTSFNNLFDNSAETTNIYIGEDGTEITSVGDVFIKQELVPDATNYIMSYQGKNNGAFVRFAYYNESTFISREISNENGHIFTVPSNCTKIDIRIDDDEDNFIGLQIEEGIEATILVINNSGNYLSKPIMKISGAGTIEFTVNDNKLFRYTFPDGEDTVIIDSQKQDAYLGTVLKNRYMSGEFPTLEIGENTITWSGTITSIKISSQSRWL